MLVQDFFRALQYFTNIYKNEPDRFPFQKKKKQRRIDIFPTPNCLAIDMK